MVLLDLSMPVMDGRAFLEAKRRDPAVAAKRTIIVSGRTERTADLQALGAKAVLVKPIDPDRLLAFLQTP